MLENTTYVLIHSPLVGPLTWRLVQRELVNQSGEVVCPALKDRGDDERPFWKQHAESLAQGLARLPPDRRVILVAHSGAGPLLPVMAQAAALPVAGYVFVDAGIPRPQASRLDLMRLQDQPWTEAFYQALLQGDRYPTWREEDLRSVIPDADLRQQVIAEVNPRALPFFAEPIPVFAGWPDAPCAYIKFSSSYDWDYREARRAGWYAREVSGGHFHMLVDAAGVTAVLLQAIQALESG